MDCRRDRGDPGDRGAQGVVPWAAPGLPGGDTGEVAHNVDAVVFDESLDPSGEAALDALPVEASGGDQVRCGPAATFATTEHFNLQTARALTVSEANGRAAIYLATPSSSLIALAFIGQVAEFHTAFYASALILLPVLAFVGVVTFLRLVQSSVEDLAFAPADRADS